MSKTQRPTRVLLVHKITTWERYRTQLQSSGQKDAEGSVVSSLQSAHAEHGDAVEYVRRSLSSDDLEIRSVQIATRQEVSWADLVITLGGDGTFLRTARLVAGTPILGVNSAPSSSVGHYCGATAQTFPEMFESILAKTASVKGLPRIRIRVGDTVLADQALNDVLFANACPACSTRYRVEVGDRAERHTSSGVWVGTGSGSGSALKSAGGQAMPWTDSRLQYVVREAYLTPADDVALLGGLLGTGITLVPRSPDVMLYLDGHHVSYPLSLGVPVHLSGGGEPLHVIGYSPGKGAHLGMDGDSIVRPGVLPVGP